MPLKFELLQADEHSRYLLRGKTDIVYNLRSLVQKRAMISAFIDASADSFLTALLEIDADNGYLILDAATDDAINRRVEAADVERRVSFRITERLRFLDRIVEGEPGIAHPGEDEVAGAIDDAGQPADLIGR